MEIWSKIAEFPDYSISNYGWARNNHTGLVLAKQRNQADVINVGLVRDGVQYKRSVPVLVARTFLPESRETFTTPIQLDGDPYNTHVDNLLWRPRWFARDYKQQMHNREGFEDPVIETNTGELFDSYWDAAMQYGLLVREMRLAIINRTYVFPTFQMFDLA